MRRFRLDILRGRARDALFASIAVCLSLTASGAQRPEPRFFADDPLSVEPETQDASKATPRDIDLFYDLSYNLFVTGRRPATGLRAQNVNTIDEVPDSSWFTNRIGTRPLTDEELTQGPNAGAPPDDSAWTITREKTSGFAPGFTASDAKGQVWFISFDAPQNPEGATGALMIGTRIFWALGYNQVEYFLAGFSQQAATIDPKATHRRPFGRRSPLTDADVREVLERARRPQDGAYRVAAGRLLPGRVLGGFEYQGTRSDDPNDIVPHQHRRELRALRVFGAWTNLTDMKAGNTLDTVITGQGRGTVRHYLQDVGSTFGVGAAGPHDWNEGWEYLYEGGATLRRLVSFGFALSPWQTADYENYPALGRFEGEAFDPETWKPRVPTAAYLEMRDDDAFWAARKVMAFSDAAIRTIVKTAQFSDPGAERHMGDVLILRRDKIGRAYLPKINPIVDPVLDSAGQLAFANAAVDHKVETAPSRYTAAWYRFDNAAGTSTSIGETAGDTPRLAPPAGLPAEAGAMVRVDIAATHPGRPSWAQPVQAFFRRDANGWKLIGFERLPEKLGRQP